MKKLIVRLTLLAILALSTAVPFAGAEGPQGPVCPPEKPCAVK